MLSAITHGSCDKAALEAMVQAALPQVDDEAALLYTVLVMCALDRP
ncbi:MAG: hypothetical protein ACPGUV_09000 [Polyangiales bacterium]